MVSPTQVFMVSFAFPCRGYSFLLILFPNSLAVAVEVCVAWLLSCDLKPEHSQTVSLFVKMAPVICRFV
jgi:hypothetical protein